MLNTDVAKEAVANFPVAQLDRVFHEAVVRTPSRVVDDARAEATAAFFGAVYRHRAARDAAESLAPLVANRSAQQTEGWRYRTQTRLFEFVVSLNSSFESSAYGLYFLGSVLAPAHFPHVVPEKRRGITLGSTTKAFQAAWPNESLTAQLDTLGQNSDYKELLDRRNLLAHRIAPGFEHRLTLVGGTLADADEVAYELAWLGEPISDLIQRTLDRAEDLLTLLWNAAEGFAIQHSSRFRA